MKVLFLYLKAFSFTGGIEKFNRSFLKALHELSIDEFANANAASVYDSVTDERYFPRRRFKGYKGIKPIFVLANIIEGLFKDVIIIGHLNLGIVGVVIKKIKPSVKFVVVAHGIEVWQKQSGFKKKALENADIILAVSNYTKSRIIQSNPTIVANKIKIFPNTIDSYFEIPTTFNKPKYLLDRYNLNENNLILLTVTRLSFSEKYKGYDNIIAVLNNLHKKYPTLKYLLCGKADDRELERINELIIANNAKEYIITTGYVKDEELIDHYLLADVFAMPSKKEGFGIVFIEAMACGRKVVAGNKDGSVDALLNGKLGVLIDPDNITEVFEGIDSALQKNLHNPLVKQQNVIDNFGFHRYKQRLQNFLFEGIS